eukprot:7167349-Pyramimonas_sp.AAC.1
MVSTWCPNGVPTVSDGALLVSRWCSDGVPMVPWWSSHGVQVVLSWCSDGVAMVFRWCHRHRHHASSRARGRITSIATITTIAGVSSWLSPEG